MKNSHKAMYCCLILFIALYFVAFVKDNEFHTYSSPVNGLSIDSSKEVFSPSFSLVNY